MQRKTEEKSENMAATGRKCNSYCVAPGCKAIRTALAADVHLYRFPKDKERSDQWAVNCGRYDLLEKPVEYRSKTYRLCSFHFEDSEFMDPDRKRLTWKAIPTLFVEVKPSVKKRQMHHRNTRVVQSNANRMSRCSAEEFAGKEDNAIVEVNGLSDSKPEAMRWSSCVDLNSSRKRGQGSVKECYHELEYAATMNAESDLQGDVSDTQGNVLNEGQTYRLNVWIAKADQSDNKQILVGYTPVNEDDLESSLPNKRPLVRTSQSEEDGAEKHCKPGAQVRPQRNLKARFRQAIHTIERLRRELRNVRQQNGRLKRLCVTSRSNC